jgi:hypothetical protein
MTQTDSSLHNVFPVGQEFTIQDIENLAYQDCVVKSGLPLMSIASTLSLRAEPLHMSKFTATATRPPTAAAV